MLIPSQVERAMELVPWREDGMRAERMGAGGMQTRVAFAAGVVAQPVTSAVSQALRAAAIRVIRS